MAGGTFDAQNKVLPGVYIRFKSNSGLGLNVGQRGTVAICEPLSWGEVGKVVEIENGADTTPYIGYAVNTPQGRFLNEIFKGTDRTPGANKVLLYRPSATGSAQATATLGELTATALYPGVRGNDISVMIAANVDNSTFTVSTIVDGEVKDVQSVAAIADLTANNWVSFSGTGNLAANSGTSLTGGVDGTVANSAYPTFLTNIEPYKFDVIIYDGTDTTTQAAFKNFVERLANENGQYSQLVTANIAGADSRFVINVVSGATLEDGTVLTAPQVCWWAGGALAGAGYNESLTYARYPDAAEVSPKFTDNQKIDALNNGQFVLFAEDGDVKVLQDINTLTTYTQDIGKVYRKNRTIRLCNTIANDVYREFSANYIGVINNNANGRMMFKSAIVNYMLTIQGQQAIQNFTADDVEVLPGEDNDSIVINVTIQTVDSVEKIYMTVTVS